MRALLCHPRRSKGPASTILLEEIGGLVNERPNKSTLYEILLLHGLPGESYHPSIVLRRSHNMRGQNAVECTLLICAILSREYGQILLDGRCTTLRNMHSGSGLRPRIRGSKARCMKSIVRLIRQWHWKRPLALRIPRSLMRACYRR